LRQYESNDIVIVSYNFVNQNLHSIEKYQQTFRQFRDGNGRAPTSPGPEVSKAENNDNPAAITMSKIHGRVYVMHIYCLSLAYAELARIDVLSLSTAANAASSMSLVLPSTRQDPRPEVSQDENNANLQPINMSKIHGRVYVLHNHRLSYTYAELTRIAALSLSGFPRSKNRAR
jgi:hypothetical protein